ncbi:WD40 repeat-containing protein, putative [Bodo saltans]|uniref:WD40 repeat-containing protein, putative n=1 Tax=Bodo saltans TaxID=75058 RepID=A0A0S4IUZ3_BODSA|nr:WD40 repeat-containing protein, putative [Bodo saltans]|eukprot:CUG01424.1 WD40 repeat-containing protein, putative [Bodo saltans]
MTSWEQTFEGLLRQRNAAQTDPFRELIASHRRLRTGATVSAQLTARVQQLEVERTALEGKLQRVSTSGGKGGAGFSGREVDLESQVATLQQRLNEALVQQADYYRMRYDLQTQDDQVARLQKRVNELEYTLKVKSTEYEDSILRLSTQATDREKTLQVLRGQLDGFQKENDKMRSEIIQRDGELQRYLQEILNSKEREGVLQNEILILEQKMIEVRVGPTTVVQEPESDHEARFTSTANLGASFGGAAITPSYVARSVEDAHHAECYSIAVTERGPTIWTGGNDKMLRSWDAALISTGSLNISSAPLCMDAVADKLIVGSPDGACRLFDTQTRRTLLQLTGHASSEKIQATYFTPSGGQVVSASGDRTIKLWDLHSSAALATMPCRSACFDLSSSHSTICSGHFDSTICVWDPRGKPTPVMEMRNVHDSRNVISVRWTPDFNQIVSLGRDNKVRMFDCRTAQASRSPMGSDKLTLSSAMMRVSLSPDGGQVACGSSSGALFVWSLRSVGKSVDEEQRPSAILEGQHKGMLPHALWLPDGRSLVSIGQDRRINLWK